MTSSEDADLQRKAAEQQAEGAVAGDGALPLALSGEDLLRYVSRLRQQLNILKPKLQAGGGRHAEEQTELPRSEWARSCSRPVDEAAKEQLRRPSRLELVEEKVGNYVERVRGLTVAVVGLGRIGSHVTMLLAKSGVGGLLIVDNGLVEERHVEGSAYTQRSVGYSKPQALRMAVFEVDPGCQVYSENLDLSGFEGIRLLKDALARFGPERKSSAPAGAEASAAAPQDGSTRQAGAKPTQSGTAQAKVDMVVSCLDSSGYQDAVNSICLDLGVPLLCVRLERDASFAAINLVVPGTTACLECLVAKDEASQSAPTLKRKQQDEGKDSGFLLPGKSDLPGVALALGGIAAQNTIKFLLGFGVVLPSFKFRSGADGVRESDLARLSSNRRAASFATMTGEEFDEHVLVPRKEFQAFTVGPFERCPNADCKRHQQRVRREAREAANTRGAGGRRASMSALRAMAG